MISKRIDHVMISVLLCIVLVIPAVSPIYGQEWDGWTYYELNMRAGPGVEYAVVAQLPGGTGLLLEARNADTSWYLGHTSDGLQRGWVFTPYLSFRDGFVGARLPISDEVIVEQPAPESTAEPDPEQPAPESTAEPDPKQPSPESTAESDLGPGAELMLSVPVISEIPASVATIVARGQQLGNHPDVFVKVGDCNAHSPAYMDLFGLGQYSLGPYGHLQATIDFFQRSENSYAAGSIAARAGFTAQVVIDPAMADPVVCQGASPLECEYDRMQPSIALIMFGLTDSYSLTPDQYEDGMREIVEISIDRGVIPVLTTIPIWSDASTKNRRILFNAIIIQLSQEYQVPLINFWLAAQPLPQGGLIDDLHVSYSGALNHRDWIALGGEEDEYGFTLWNLLTLEMLEKLRVRVLS